MAVRLTRAEQTERNRGEVLAAARRVFVDRGFHAASLDLIAAEAGFSKGVVYSQFRSKADLFLTLLEERIAVRAGEELRLAETLTGIEQYAVLLEAMRRRTEADRSWSLLVVEFRVVAARDAELGDRYRAAHRRTVEGIAAALDLLYRRSGAAPPAPLDVLAVTILGIANGMLLEEAVVGPLPGGYPVALVGRVLGVPPA